MLVINDLSFSYNTTSILNAISCTVQPGEFLAVIGASGSGKSTLLKLIYGELDASQGTIYWKRSAILGPKHHLVVDWSFMKYVAQEFDLMPYITVEDNIGKFLSRFDMTARQDRINELLKVVELSSFSKTKVKYLSGGQQQRVALARALAATPELILLDEPFSHIDNFKTQSLRRNLFNYLKLHQITCIVATHDSNDVLGFADQIMVLHDTKVVAKDTPMALYKNPKTALVASFFSEYNCIKGRIYYAHQLQIVDASNRKAIVKQSYFKGAFWLIEAEHNSQSVFIQHKIEIAKNTVIYFDVT